MPELITRVVYLRVQIMGTKIKVSYCLSSEFLSSHFVRTGETLDEGQVLEVEFKECK